MALTIHTKDLGHGHWMETFRHDCYLMFRSPAFWVMIASIAVIALIFGLATLFGGTTAGLEGPLPVYHNIYYPMMP